MTGGAAQSAVTGRLVETMNSGGYTYALVEKGSEKIWVAVSEVKIAAGSQVSFLPGMVISGFTSSSLNRTFERIIFSTGLAGY